MDPYPLHLPSDNLESSNSPSSLFDSYDKQDHTNTPYTVRWKSGKRVDPRLLGLLESFGEIYVDRHDFFNRIFHGDHEEVFRKIGDVLKKKKQMKKTRSMKRSTSMRAIRYRGIEDGNGFDEMRLERFKIRAPNVIVAGGDDDGQVDRVMMGFK